MREASAPARRPGVSSIFAVHASSPRPWRHRPVLATDRARVDLEVHRRDESMRLRLADSLAAAIAALGVPEASTGCRTIARFAIDASALACEAAESQDAVDEVFQMIEAAWGPRGSPERPSSGF